MDIGEFNTRVLPLRDSLFHMARSLLGNSCEAEDALQDIREKL